MYEEDNSAGTGFQCRSTQAVEAVPHTGGMTLSIDHHGRDPREGGFDLRYCLIFRWYRSSGSFHFCGVRLVVSINEVQAERRMLVGACNFDWRYIVGVVFFEEWIQSFQYQSFHTVSGFG
jgi:hypothetical protein